MAEVRIRNRQVAHIGGVGWNEKKGNSGGGTFGFTCGEGKGLFTVAISVSDDIPSRSILILFSPARQKVNQKIPDSFLIVAQREN